MKVVINRCFGGFSISKEAAELMAEMGCERAKKELQETKDSEQFYGYGIVEGMPDGYDRTSKYLVAAVEKLGNKASGKLANLKVVEIPDDVEYEIDDYDGSESIHEKHRIWG